MFAVYLKSLKLVGFKSFADRTRLEFRPGVTVVVGPNGSGKSNLVDALLVGDGYPIRQGVAHGKDGGRRLCRHCHSPRTEPEATLVIDNAERMLPLDLDEVALTWRLYRDGSSITRSTVSAAGFSTCRNCSVTRVSAVIST